MTSTFLVAINLNDGSDLTTEALDIQDHLSSLGFDVESVHPWARPNMPTAQPAGGFTSLTGAPDPNLQP